MPTAYDKKLHELADLADEVAKLIHKDIYSPDTRGGAQQSMRPMYSKRDSGNEGLAAIEGQAKSLAQIIRANIKTHLR